MIMDYEKAYKEALNRAKLLKDNPDKVVTEKYKTIHASEIIFPELRESEDVKIKKDLIEWFKDFPDKVWWGHYTKDIVAWLEKNGEQKTIEEVNGEDYGIDALWHAQRILEKTLGSVDGYQSDDGILEHEAAITIVKKLYEQNHVEWNEEDERLFQIVIDILDRENHRGKLSTTNLIACVRKLKSVKDKIQPKQGKETSLQTNKHAWLHLVSDVLTWKDGIGQYLDDPRVQELAKKLCSEYGQKLYKSTVS